MNPAINQIKKILVANRAEIAIRVLRAASELNIRTIAVYSYEDRYSLHRYKADESYQIGADDESLKPYLDIDEIIRIAVENEVDAIHPGYGFLSENVDFVKKCNAAGIKFIGPTAEAMQALGNKVEAKHIARKANVPLIEDSVIDLKDEQLALSEADRIGYPVMVKAAAGGGGRGMRVVRSSEELLTALKEASREAANAFGSGQVFLEKFIESPKHIEVQILADQHANIVHLYERDCSLQRRFQKVIEVAPAAAIKESTRQALCRYALNIATAVAYQNAGTVEFLLDEEENIYFIEVNPRIQVEHTITEVITGIDIVRSQILIAMNYPLNDPSISIERQEDIKCNGFAIQCRITTEDPAANFKPDYGQLVAYRSAAGFGIRLDSGSAFTGAKISPFFDSMLVKVTASGRSLKEATSRMHRALREFRIRGVKSNIGFLLNVLQDPVFQEGEVRVNFIDNNPQLTKLPQRQDRGTKTLRYLANVIVNGNTDVKFIDPNKIFRKAEVPKFSKTESYPKGSKDKLLELGRSDFLDWLKNEKSIQFTDTTFRDAHQSLLATRVRSYDMLKVAESFAKNNPNVFSMEVWGGATFDVSLRFLKECPWQRLARLRKAVPNILLQMLLRGSNAVGYTAYPDNLIERFVEKAAETGIDIFRIFDSLNWVEAMKVSIKTVRERTNAIAEACICYTGDISNPNKSKYNLQYYVDLAKRLEDEGAHILCIKDMAGLLQPYAAQELISTLKESVELPIHLHTHDTSSIQSATYLKAIEAGVDIVDVALSSMSGLTSQPNFNAIAKILEFHERAPKVDVNTLNPFSNYWEVVREFYYPFETELKAGTAEVYQHEIPGGQYSNLRPQARGLGLEDQFETIKTNYETVNHLFGNLIKVTPSSKVVGDMAMFMTANNLNGEDILQDGHNIDFPDSVKAFFRGSLGQPHGGFPAALQKMVLKDEQPFTERPNAHLEPIDFDKGFKEFQEEFDEYQTELDFISYKLYPKVFRQYYDFYQEYNAVDRIPTLPFFYGLKANEETLIEIENGKSILVKYLGCSEADEDGFRIVNFELNGQLRSVPVKDHNIEVHKVLRAKAEGPMQIGAPLPGSLAKILVNEGDLVEAGTPLFIIEAMKMESTITASFSARIKKIYLGDKTLIDQDDLIIELEEV